MADKFIGLSPAVEDGVNRVSQSRSHLLRRLTSSRIPPRMQSSPNLNAPSTLSLNAPARRTPKSIRYWVACDCTARGRHEFKVGVEADNTFLHENFHYFIADPSQFDDSTPLGRQMILIDPAGNALPCHAAAVIPNLEFDNVRAHDLGWIWRESSAFQRFRGDAWMPETCLKCARKEIDFGGCRCQAYLLTRNASAIDPVCRYSPSHGLLETLRTGGAEPVPIWRTQSVPGDASGHENQSPHPRDSRHTY